MRHILVTGTPLQNNLIELMSLLAILMPSIFVGKMEAVKAVFSKVGFL
jgi:SNF2 family DNA or RNA helicase